MTVRWFYGTLLASAAMSLAACELPQPQYPTSDNYKSPPPIPTPTPQYPTTDSAAPPTDDHAPKAAPTTGVDSQSLPPAEKAPSAWRPSATSPASPYLIQASYDVILADSAASAAKGRPKPKAKPQAHAAAKTKPEHTAALRGPQERAEPEAHAAREEGETGGRGARTVKVKPGQTLDAIARETGVSPDDLVKANGLKRPFHVVAGHTLKIPRAEETASAERSKAEGKTEGSRAESARAEARDETSRSETARTETAKAAKAPKAYVAKRGDTVYALARRFKIAPGEIEAANGFGRDVRLHPGQRVLLPRPAGETEEAAAPPPRHEVPPPRRRPQAELAEVARPAPRAAAPAPSVVIPPAAANTPAPTPSSGGLPRPYALADAGLSPNQSPSQPVPYSAMSGSSLAAPPQKPLRAPPARTYTPSVYAQSQASYARPAPTTPAYTAPTTPQPYASTPQPYASTPQPYASTGQPYVAPPTRPAAPPVEAAPPPTDAQVVLAGRGRFAWPVRGNIISGYGPKPGGQRNDGLDIAASEGSPVHAAAAGEVVYAGDQVPGFGNLVLIKHEDGWVTAYAHLSKTEVKIKDRVAQGGEIGLAGETGGAIQPEVHFEIRYAPTPRDKARPVDPALLLNNP